MVPRGFAHGLLTLEDNTIVTYLTDNKYNQSKERTLQWDTVPEIKERVLELIGDSELILSDKDKIGLSFDEY
jgi:dTDP-4-dehydrorhamnose 3,5-epimerase